MKMTPFLEYIVYDIFSARGGPVSGWGGNEPITYRAMMGAHILYYEGKAFAIAEDDELYFKGSKELMEWYMSRGSKQFVYKKEGKDAYLYYFFVPPEIYENRDSREEWLDMALLVAKPPRASQKSIKFIK